MKKIGIEPLKKESISFGKFVLHTVFLSLLVLSFTVFSLYSKITERFFSNHKIDIFTELPQVASYFWVVDPEVARQILQLDLIIKDYLSGANVLKTREEELTALWSYAKENKDYLTKLGFGNYKRILKMLSDARPLREEIFQLLGKDQRFNYLVPLQNSNESRPNGGFFGSFAFISLSGGHIVDMQIIDSYLPDMLAPNTRGPLPERTLGFLREKAAWVIGGNKFWMTDKDWRNLKQLYEKIFHTAFDPQKREKMFNQEQWNQLFQKNIKGIIFLDSELITYLLPAFRSKTREWQFVNANVDLIRGENRSNKKEFYIKDLQRYLKDNALTLAKSTINNIQELLHKGFINIYLSNVSDEMRTFLKDYDLTNVYNPDFFYFFHINSSFNKSDGFVKKQVEVLGPQGNVLLSTEERKLDIHTLSPGTYTLHINYTLDIPKTYQDEIFALEKSYWIEMTDRERHILALQPKNPDPTIPLKWWEAKAIFYFPKNVEILGIQGDAFNEKQFEADFAKGITYQSRISTNQTTNTISIKIQIF